MPLTGSTCRCRDPTTRAATATRTTRRRSTDWQHLDAVGSLNHYADPNPTDSTFQSGNSAKVGTPTLGPHDAEQRQLARQRQHLRRLLERPYGRRHVPARRVHPRGDVGHRVHRLRAQPACRPLEQRQREHPLPHRWRRRRHRAGQRQQHGDAAARSGHLTTVDAATGCARTGRAEPARHGHRQRRRPGRGQRRHDHELPRRERPAPDELDRAPGSSPRPREPHDVLGNALGTPCFSFGSIWMHTRSSTTPTSDMKDYIAPSPLIVRSCAASGTKFHDLDADGIKDAGEPGLAGFRMFADFNNDGVRAGRRAVRRHRCQRRLHDPGQAARRGRHLPHPRAAHARRRPAPAAGPARPPRAPRTRSTGSRASRTATDPASRAAGARSTSSRSRR